eukprot:5353727-Prymnesium_polylepis.2
MESRSRVEPWAHGGSGAARVRLRLERGESSADAPVVSISSASGGSWRRCAARSRLHRTYMPSPSVGACPPQKKPMSRSTPRASEPAWSAWTAARSSRRDDAPPAATWRRASKPRSTYGLTSCRFASKPYLWSCASIRASLNAHIAFPQPGSAMMLKLGLSAALASFAFLSTNT